MCSIQGGQAHYLTILEQRTHNSQYNRPAQTNPGVKGHHKVSSIQPQGHQTASVLRPQVYNGSSPNGGRQLRSPKNQKSSSQKSSSQKSSSQKSSSQKSSSPKSSRERPSIQKSSSQKSSRERPASLRDETSPMPPTTPLPDPRSPSPKKRFQTRAAEGVVFAGGVCFSEGKEEEGEGGADEEHKEVIGLGYTIGS
ncbi:myristoylated alanine-rich C-kinase substrate-like [Penaeus japonicus]|uniref:myristoylated alanine-rich C-kinase substrate-like n=1 Tax=Penaeus japonicus TaxID=27405 RepID=UPI001C7141BE|nr:myristoylated alanine-rich C-kinase substrate-like [Penaeus japonicus]